MWTRLCDGFTAPNEVMPTYEDFIDALETVVMWDSDAANPGPNAGQSADELMAVILRHIVSIMSTPSSRGGHGGGGGVSVTNVFVDDEGGATLSKAGLPAYSVEPDYESPYLYTLCTILAAVVGWAVNTNPLTSTMNLAPQYIVSVCFSS